MALSLRAELYHTLDDLEELSAHLPDAGADGAWKYIPSLAAMTPDAVSSGANVVSTAVGRSVGMGMGLLSGTSSVVHGGGSMVWGASAKKKFRGPLFLSCPPPTPSQLPVRPSKS